MLIKLCTDATGVLSVTVVLPGGSFLPNTGPLSLLALVGEWTPFVTLDGVLLADDLTV